MEVPLVRHQSIEVGFLFFFSSTLALRSCFEVLVAPQGTQTTLGLINLALAAH